jgi:hypothetical protein
VAPTSWKTDASNVSLATSAPETSAAASAVNPLDVTSALNNAPNASAAASNLNFGLFNGTAAGNGANVNSRLLLNSGSDADLVAQLSRLLIGSATPLPWFGLNQANLLNSGALLSTAAHQSNLHGAGALSMSQDLLRTSALLAASSQPGLLGGSSIGSLVAGSPLLSMNNPLLQLQPGIGSSLLGLDVLSRLNATRKQ